MDVDQTDVVVKMMCMKVTKVVMCSWRWMC